MTRKSAAIPRGRLARLGSIGALAGKVAGNVLAQGSMQLARGERPEMAKLLLSEQNVGQVAEQLAKMRGAAMKVGQLLSMDTGNLLPEGLSQVLAKLRNEAHSMPAAQLYDQLERHWGSDWELHFNQFSFTPVAAASIGQVHSAEHVDGRQLAIKVQYPGVRESIDSDIDNVLSVLRLSGLLPVQLDIEPLVAEARAQLACEADYGFEAQALDDYRSAIAALPWRDRLQLPELEAKLSNRDILTMSYVQGQPVGEFASADQSLRDSLGQRMLELFYAEFLSLQLVQTDPNPANFLYDRESGRLGLVDFGATRRYSDSFVDSYLAAIEASIAGNKATLTEALEQLGFFKLGLSVANREAVLDIFALATEPLRQPGVYDFSTSDLPARLRAAGKSLSKDPAAWHTPPPDVLFLHRKLGGLFMLACQLGARVDTESLYQPYAQARFKS